MTTEDKLQEIIREIFQKVFDGMANPLADGVADIVVKAYELGYDERKEREISNSKRQSACRYFAAELNALLKKYEHLPKEELAECMKFYLGEVEQKPKKISIWKHWKDGIAGGAEGEQIFLTKIGRIYSISSCLGCECDFIELSELDKL